MGACNNNIEINSPITIVWETICDFHDMSWAPDVITSLNKVGVKSGDQVGAKRVLNDLFCETLLELNEDQFTFSYSIDDGPGPMASTEVDDYISVVKLTESANGTLVEWNSSFESENDEQVSEFCNPIYRALLSALKETLS